MQLLRLGTILILHSNLSFSQVRVSGFINESNSGESVSFASVSIDSASAGTSANAYGFYSLLVPRHPIILRVSAMGYSTLTLYVAPQRDTVIQIFLTESPTILDEVSVVDEAQAIVGTEPVNRINTSFIKKAPALLGEKDVLKTIQLLPGVQFGTEGTNALHVRGGTPDQNLIILDDAPVYNASHLFGFFSVFNADATTNVNFWKSGFPAQYGGRVSSIVDLKMKQGNKQLIAGEGGIGILSARMTLEGPIKAGKSSFLVSGRRSFLDLFVTPLITDEEAKYRLYDFNAKMNFEVNARNKFYLSMYTGNDKMVLSNSENLSSSRTSSKTELGWGNLITTFRWSHVFGQQVFANTTVFSSRFNFHLSDEFNKSQPLAQYQFSTYESGISDYGIKTDFDYFINDRHTLKTGYLYTYHRYSPKAFQYEDQSLEISENSFERHKNHELGLYIEEQWTPDASFTLRVGARYNVLVAPRKTYTALEPRAQASYNFGNGLSIVGSYTRANQFVHLLSTTGIGLATDLWVPVTERVPPVQSDQVSFRISKRLRDRDINVSFETYRKYLRNIINYTNDASFLVISEAPTDISWEDNVTRGKGKGFGSELMVEKSGRLSGWVGYTLSWNVHEFDDLNNGMAFYARQDSRHSVSTNASYQLSKKILLALTWTYRSGFAMNAPQGYYFAHTTNFSQDIINTSTLPYYGALNSFRTQAYHRLDISAQFYKKKRKYERFWEVGVFNAYNRKNPFYYYLKAENVGGGGQRLILKKRALFPIIPSLSYNIKF